MLSRSVHILSLIGLAFGAALSGCARLEVTPTSVPVFPVPPTFVMAEVDHAALPTPWWTAFDDPVLDALVETALAGNLTLAQGRARVDRASALLQQAQALRKPTLNMEGGLRREWERIVHREGADGPTLDERVNELNSAIDAFNSGGGGGGGDTGDSEGKEPRNLWSTPYDLGVLLQWELDFWGRLRNAARAESARFDATTLDYAALRLSISAQVVEAYYQALEQRLQLALLEEQLRSAEDFLGLIELRFLQGGASSVDLLQQQGQVAEIKAEMPVARARLGLLENRLDTLVGLAPDGSARTADSEYDLPATEHIAGIGIPAGLLARRPDVQAAQRRAAASDYAVAVAIADRLPRITLDGSLVFGGTAETATFTALSGLGLFQPLLDWGRRRAVVDASRAALEEDLLLFSEIYLGAIEEVETTLWQETQQRALLEALAQREEILQRTLEQTRLRYSQGVTDYLPVLTAQQELQDVQREILLQRRILVSLRIQLYRALGAPTRVSPSPDETAPVMENHE